MVDLPFFAPEIGRRLNSKNMRVESISNPSQIQVVERMMVVFDTRFRCVYNPLILWSCGQIYLSYSVAKKKCVKLSPTCPSKCRIRLLLVVPKDNRPLAGILCGFEVAET